MGKLILLVIVIYVGQAEYKINRDFNIADQMAANSSITSITHWNYYDKGGKEKFKKKVKPVIRKYHYYMWTGLGLPDNKL